MIIPTGGGYQRIVVSPDGKYFVVLIDEKPVYCGQKL